ncbi:MAG: dTDP-4-dehydrorhamnose 3,5-epimerase [Candidatus Berkelbacteria bacterium Licking1014_96]|uniref:dTDP-4-dehydrorhamnose 3,5-epimerase n=1 Tax=Candidatus Berkelbacteria bacterium Licking1014_96 TaxID=2017149 RepID=A0A554LBQ7_9BACT|nr:MAG: dTDP-4-dehydrorhamnose 3,5-epimerase [Candidatus Berkelbacteria bacterium Licking1014_96]
MIDGVKEKNLIRHHDDRGYFSEIVRDDEKLLSRFGQASISNTYPNVIKAFHWHKYQDDLWFCVSGNIQAVLYDRRPRSKTKGETTIFYLGDDNPKIVLIPKGVAHGYRVLGTNPAVLVYFTTKSYNAKNPDEQRISFDDEIINFDWQTKNR